MYAAGITSIPSSMLRFLTDQCSCYRVCVSGGGGESTQLSFSTVGCTGRLVAGPAESYARHPCGQEVQSGSSAEHFSSDRCEGPLQPKERECESIHYPSLCMRKFIMSLRKHAVPVPPSRINICFRGLLFYCVVMLQYDLCVAP